MVSKKIYAALGILALLGVSSFLTLRSHPLEQILDRFSPAPMRFAPEHGEQFRYQIQYRSDSQSESDDKINIAIAKNITMNFDGILTLTSWRETVKGQEFFGELAISPLDSSVSLPTNPLYFSALISSQYEISDIKMLRSEFEAHSFILIDVLKNFQLSLPRESPHSQLRWTGIESFMKDDVPLKFNLCRDQQELLCITKSYGNSRGVQVSGQGIIHLNRNSYAVNSIRSDKKTSNTGPGGILIHTSSQFTATLIETRKVPPTGWSGSDLVVEQLNQSQYQAYLERESYKNLLGQETIESLKAQLEQASPSSLKSNMKIYQLLRALFALHPEAIAHFADYLREYSTSDERFNVLAVAITDTRGPLAEKALLDPIQSDVDLPKKLRLLTHIAFKAAVSQETETTLFEMAQTEPVSPFQRSIELALGGVAHNNRSDSPERSKQVFQYFREKLEHAPDTAVETHYLTVIGNIGIPEQVPTLAAHVGSADSQTRAMAYQGLRFIPGQETADILINGLTQDKNQVVREVIADSFTYRPNGGQELRRIESLLASETNITVIKALIRSLASEAKSDPQVPAFLQNYLQNCGHPDLCSFVRGVYEGL